MVLFGREGAFSKVLNSMICPRDQNQLLDFRCSKCGTEYVEVGGIFRFLPEIWDKGKIQEKKRYDVLGRARSLEDLDPRGGFYQRKNLLNETRVSAVIQDARIDNDQLLLDVGCGSGFATLSLMKKKRVYVVGLDISVGALEFFQERALEKKMRERVLLFQADAENMPFAANLFDRVISFSSIEHVPNPDRFIEECIRVCRPGGYVSACAPNRRADSLRRLKPFFLNFASMFSKNPPSVAESEVLPASPYHKEFTDKELHVLFERSELEDLSTSFLIYLPTGVPHPLGTFMAMRPIAYFEKFMGKMLFIRKFSSLLVVSSRKRA
jgi:ubiquinone/menaquinone biosynthesis C-methylase UbiE